METRLYKNTAYYARYTENSSLGVIIVHGLTEHKGRYEEFANELFQSSISVFAIDLRGHGESSGAKGDLLRFEDYLTDIDAFVKHIKAEFPDMKLAIFGHSLGGLVATAFVEKSDLINLLILSSPVLELPSKIKKVRWLPAWLLGSLKFKKRHSESKEMLKYGRNDPLACQFTTLRLLKAAFIHGVRRVKRIFQNITLPVLMLGGQLDNLVNSGNLNSILEKFGSSDKTIIIYKNAKHRIVQNDAKDTAIADIIDWLKIRGL